VKTVCEVIGVAHSNVCDQLAKRPARKRGRPPLSEAKLVAEIKAEIGAMPSYGYGRG
jgi:putative transposase